MNEQQLEAQRITGIKLRLAIIEAVKSGMTWATIKDLTFDTLFGIGHVSFPRFRGRLQRPRHRRVTHFQRHSETSLGDPAMTNGGVAINRSKGFRKITREQPKRAKTPIFGRGKFER